MKPAATGRKRRRIFLPIMVLILLAALAWPIGLVMWISGKIPHVDALSGAPGTWGTTYLITGSDKRSDDSPFQDDTEGERADTIMLLHKRFWGTPALVSIPRDTWVNIPGYGENKINASYALGGAPLLVETVEELTGLTVDHYVEVGMGSVSNMVDAVGGVELCLDYDVSDPKSELEWEAGCHLADGPTALAFSRMRYSDPRGDIGRTERQRQVVKSTMNAALTPSNALIPWNQVDLAQAGAAAVVTDPSTGSWALGKMALYLRSAMKAELNGPPPIAETGYETSAGVAVLLDPERAPEFFGKLREGTLTKADFTDNEPQ
ncbi:MAG: LCP family protein [Actinomycetaceae bacterium]|nr:LCP family protein [Actinomycetaceae bacterium]